MACFVVLIIFVLLPSVSANWKRVSDAEKDQQIRLIFALKLVNIRWLDQMFWAVSDPKSADYGNYMNFNEIAAKVRARPGAVERVTALLRRNGVSIIDVSAGGNYLIAWMKCSSANKIFNTTFGNYIFDDYPEIVVHKTTTYTVPNEIVDDIEFVLGIDTFPKIGSSCTTQVKLNSLLSVESETTPASIMKSYNISSYESSSPGNSQAVAAFLSEYFRPSDLHQFQEHYKVPTNPVAKVVGVNSAQKAKVESSLDLQYITSIGRKVATWFVYTPGLVNHGQEDFLTWIVGQTNTTDSPWVHSVSYGDVESSIPDSFKTRVNIEFQKFGVSGRTVLFSSGDSGTGCHNEKYVPNWPTSSPYVTSVGGTTRYQDTEKAAPFGGGGFSNFFEMPHYQKDAVQKYLQSNKAPSTNFFNKTGRAYPDMSAFATNCEIVYDNSWLYVDGTSCASPIVAGIVSLLNDVRMKQGKKTLGFINPLLYQLAGKGFHDIAEGSNGNGICPGFKAAKGWDPTSGWGSPNFGILKGLV